MVFDLTLVKRKLYYKDCWKKSKMYLKVTKCGKMLDFVAMWVNDNPAVIMVVFKNESSKSLSE